MMNSSVLLSPPDPRDYTVSAVTDVSEDFVIPADFQVWQPPVENQGGAGNCVAQSLANIMECIAYNESLEEYLISIGVNFLTLSPEEYIRLLNDVQGIIYTPKDYSVGFIFGSPLNSAEDGMYPREACEILLKQGDVLREEWESLWGNPLCKIQWRDQVTEEIKSKADKIMAYVRINTKEEMQAFMLKYKLPVMLIAQTKNFAETSSDGYHATVCYGWISEETYNANPKKYNDYNESDYEDLLFTNSWGVHFHSNSGRGTCKSWNMDEIWGIVPVEQIKLTDIDTSWANQDIQSLINLGIVTGYTDNTYKPKNQVTREEMAALLMRVIRHQDNENKALKERIQILEKKLGINR